MKRAVALVLLTVPSLARANTPEDVEGLGARTIAMGGAGTALATDATAIYYNPASLARCADDALLVEARHNRHALRVDGQPPAPVKPVDDETRVTLGGCNHGPAGFAFGFALGSGMGHALATSQTTLSPEPQFVRYGDLQQHLTIMLGAAWAVSPRLSLGAGLSVLTNSTLTIAADVPLVTGDTAEVSSAIDISLDPVAAPYLGVAFAASDALELGATYRSPLFHELNAPAAVNANIAGLPVSVDLLLEAVSWYSPRSLAAGATYTRGDVTVAADLTWYQWSAYPGPFIVVSPAEPGGVADSLKYPPKEDAGFTDTLVPRAGLEYRVGGGAVRGGLAYQPAMVATPRGRSNLLDSAVTTFTVGAGTTWRYGDEDEDEDEDTTTTSPRPKHTRGTITVDAFARARVLSSTDVHKPATGDAPAEDYSFGGSVVDLGVTATLTWD